MTPSPPRRLGTFAATGSVVALGLLVAGCQAAPVQPRTAVTCFPGRIAVAVTNLSTTAARYTVTVKITRAGYTDTEQYSSDLIQAGASATINDDLPGEQARCRVSGVQVWNA